MFSNTKLHSKSCRYLYLYDVLRTYSLPVVWGIFSGIDISCFVPQSTDTKLLMLPLRTLHWHCWGHSDKQKQASVKKLYFNHIRFQSLPCIQRYYQLDGRGDLDQGRFRKRALFNRSLCLLRLKADTSCIAACLLIMYQQYKKRNVVCWERNAKFHKNPKAANHSMTIHSCPVIRARFFFFIS